MVPFRTHFRSNSQGQKSQKPQAGKDDAQIKELPSSQAHNSKGRAGNVPDLVVTHQLRPHAVGR